MKHAELAQSELEPEIAHQRPDHTTTLELATLMEVAGNDEQQLITVHDGAGVIDHEHTIPITIEGDADVRVLGDHFHLQRFHVGGTALVVDVQPIGLSREHRYVAAELAEDAGSDLVSRPVRAIDHDLEPREIGTHGHRTLAELDVAAGRIIDT